MYFVYIEMIIIVIHIIKMRDYPEAFSTFLRRNKVFLEGVNFYYHSFQMESLQIIFICSEFYR